MKKFLSIFVIGILLLSLFGTSAATRSKKSDISRNLDIFNSVYKELQTNYVDTIDAEKSINTAIAAMLSEIDPYTEYIPEKDQDEFRTISTGEYAGIGSYIMQRGGNVYISEPQEGSPAQEAGLRPGDLIIKVDSDTVLGWTTSKVSERLRGQMGTTVKVLVKRPYVEDSILAFDITRSKIQIQDLPYYGVIGDGIGYIYLTTFNEKSAKDVRDALTELKNRQHVKSVILDLRDNGGGLLESAVKIVGLFTPRNTEVLCTRGKGILNEKVYKTTANPIDTEIPLVVLIDNGTASSSEIVAGALQDLDRAVIVGNRSYGKGLVQSTRPIPYNGLLKVTTAKYYIPSGRLIQAIDYSRRNPDGSAARIPDSLTSEFKTVHGRTVRDGGGITPDIEVIYPDVNRLTFNIVKDNWAFDYANRFAATTPAIAPAETFVITDSIYEDFKRFIDPDKFKYDKVCELRLADLKEAAEQEGYMNDSVEVFLTGLDRLLRHDLNHDLDKNRKEIGDLLSGEIVQRYYFNRGQIIESLRHDIAIDSAVSVLEDIAKYRLLLSPKRSLE